MAKQGGDDLEDRPSVGEYATTKELELASLGVLFIHASDRHEVGGSIRIKKPPHQCLISKYFIGGLSRRRA
jgi:hypothetical protein